MTAITVAHGTILRIHGARAARYRLVTLGGTGAPYGDFDGPHGAALYAAHAARNRADWAGGPDHDRHNGMVWLSAQATIIVGARLQEHHASQLAEDVHVYVGDTIRVQSACPGEGGLYTILAGRPGRDGDECRLVPDEG